MDKRAIVVRRIELEMRINTPEGEGIVIGIDDPFGALEPMIHVLVADGVSRWFNDWQVFDLNPGLQWTTYNPKAFREPIQ